MFMTVIFYALLIVGMTVGVTVTILNLLYDKD